MSKGKVVVAGGLGMLGRVLCPWLMKRGWEVVVLSRNSEFSVQNSEWNAIRICRWDGRTVGAAGAWAGELEGAFGVINLAGRSVNCRYTARNRRAILDSRVESTRVIGEAIARCARPPRVWLNSSTATIYRHTQGPAWNEDGEIGATREAKDSFSVEVARAWEKEFFGDNQRSDVRKVAMRTAIVMGRGEGNVVGVLRGLVRWGLGGRMGSGEQWVSWIHEEDFCRAVEFLLEGTLGGVVNVASPNAVRNREMMGMMREFCGRRIGLPAARWMLEVGAWLLRTETELVIKSRRVAPGRLVEAGFGFEWPEMRGALGDLLG